MKKENATQVAELIKSQRAKLGLTQQQLAAALGYDNPQFISLIERGESKLPSDIFPKVLSVLAIPEARLKKALVKDYEAEIESSLMKLRSKSSKKIKVTG